MEQATNHRTGVCLWLDAFSVALGFLPLHQVSLPVQLNRPPQKAWISTKGQLVCSWPLPTDPHLLKSVTFHTFASAGGLPHAVPTIWTNRLKKKNHRYHLSTTNKIGIGEKLERGMEWEEYESLKETGMGQHLIAGFAFQKKSTLTSVSLATGG